MILSCIHFQRVVLLLFDFYFLRRSFIQRVLFDGSPKKTRGRLRAMFEACLFGSRFVFRLQTNPKGGKEKPLVNTLQNTLVIDFDLVNGHASVRQAFLLETRVRTERHGFLHVSAASPPSFDRQRLDARRTTSKRLEIVRHLAQDRKVSPQRRMAADRTGVLAVIKSSLLRVAFV